MTDGTPWMGRASREPVDGPPAEQPISAGVSSGARPADGVSGVQGGTPDEDGYPLAGCFYRCPSQRGVFVVQEGVELSERAGCRDQVDAVIDDAIDAACQAVDVDS